MFRETKISRSGFESRAIETPDGVSHVVALDPRWWDCLDWMVKHKGESLEDIADFCWRFERDFPGDEFAALIEYYLHCYMRDHRRDHFSLSNDNLLPDEREETTR